MERKVAIRQCVGCAAKGDKRDMIRVVRTPEGDITLDFKGKMNGRGAYLCNDLSCLRKARKKRSLQRSLDTPVPDEILDELERSWEVPVDG